MPPASWSPPTTIYPHEPRRQWEQSVQTIKQLCAKHNVELIAIGNGTASRETDKLAGEAIKAAANPKLQKVVVSEAGRLVYSASEFRGQGVPGAGRVAAWRGIDRSSPAGPAAELVKIEPKAIGVGQYQHDVDQYRLARALDARVEDCVNAVGVYVNTASAALLSRCPPVGHGAENIVRHRDDNGPFKRRKDLLKVARLGEKTFEQCAGFLRIADGDQPLDASAVHPEATRG